MPVLIINGLIDGKPNGISVAGQCEWCGVELSREECRPVSSVFDGEMPTNAEWIAVLTRMCQDCIDIYCALGSDGLREPPYDAM
jgi:hypothetical protein